uniref:U6 snRNA-associated Sm-like protein LSm2 n=1 Tax=Sinocyclocheilus anshuiensis TaxID=1608454 RepID=A0A671T000_9TELE
MAAHSALLKYKQILSEFHFKMKRVLPSQYLNIKLTDISVTDPEKYPHMLSVKNCFIRGSVVRYVQLPADEVDTQLLQDAARKEAMQQKQ